MLFPSSLPPFLHSNSTMNFSAYVFLCFCAGKTTSKLLNKKPFPSLDQTSLVFSPTGLPAIISFPPLFLMPAEKVVSSMFSFRCKMQKRSQTHWHVVQPCFPRGLLLPSFSCQGMNEARRAMFRNWKKSQSQGAWSENLQLNWIAQRAVMRKQTFLWDKSCQIWKYFELSEESMVWM